MSEGKQIDKKFLFTKEQAYEQTKRFFIKKWSEGFSSKQLEEELDKLLSLQPTEDKWISVEERTPEKEGWYLVWGKDCEHEMGYMNDKLELKSWGEENITHWQPLPEPPKSKTT